MMPHVHVPTGVVTVASEELASAASSISLNTTRLTKDLHILATGTTEQKIHPLKILKQCMMYLAVSNK